ncbi:MAG: hypothetical protein R2747_12690 [Pyrinomonadaceae bacterium]
MRFFLFSIFASLLLTTPGLAQSRDVLAAGNPPLTQTMVNRLTGLMEWSLDSHLSDEERSQLRRVVIAYWKNGDQKSIRSILDTLAFEEKLAGVSEDQKSSVQPQIRRQLLEAFEKDPAEPLNKVLLGAYKRNGETDSAKTPNGGGSLSDLVGRWQVSHMNSMTTENVYTGAIGDANGMIAEYDLRPDGRVIFSFYLSQNNHGCTTRIKTTKTGRASVKGSTVTFAYESGTTTASDSCNGKNNYTKTLGKTSETFNFDLKRESGKTQFCFANSQLKDCAVKLN